MNSGLFTSNTDEWTTPQWLFDQLNMEFGFTLDVCANQENTKCKLYFDKKTNGLLQQWSGTCWMNPPYGRQINKWIKKAYESSLQGATVVCLLPARTDTSWWHEYCINGKAEIRFLRGRLKFGNCKNNAPFPNAIVIYKKD